MLFSHYSPLLGGQLTMVIIHPDSKVEIIKMGHNMLAGKVMQHVVPTGTWFSTFVSASDYAFMGNTNTPGFVYQDDYLGNKTALQQQFPQAANWINFLAS